VDRDDLRGGGRPPARRPGSSRREARLSLRVPPGIEIREADAGDAPGIRRLFARTFGVELSEAEWQWKFADDPDGWFGMVAVRGGEIVGNYAGWAMRFRLGGGDEGRVLYSVGDVATDPGVRGLGRGVYREMARAFYEAVGARGVPFCFGFPNARALAISHRLVGSRTLFPIREVSVPIEAFPEAHRDVSASDSAGSELDPIWEAARAAIREGAVRDRRRVNWRFHARPTRYYRMVWTDGGSGEVPAWAVLSVVGERALVADLLVAGEASAWPAALPPLFSAAASEARRLGARRLVFWETPGGPAASTIASLPGERSDVGYPIIVRPLDESAVERFAADAHLVPSLYDLV
jgi:hypothetical protein